MHMKLELIPIPVTDIDRSITFYIKLGFNIDLDTVINESMRIVQLTPTGSACSILLSAGLPAISEMQPGSHKGMHLVVGDVHKAAKTLTDLGIQIGNINEYDRGVKDFSFSDPDGNLWVVQEMAWRAGDFAS